MSKDSGGGGSNVPPWQPPTPPLPEDIFGKPPWIPTYVPPWMRPPTPAPTKPWWISNNTFNPNPTQQANIDAAKPPENEWQKWIQDWMKPHPKGTQQDQQVYRDTMNELSKNSTFENNYYTTPANPKPWWLNWAGANNSFKMSDELSLRNKYAAANQNMVTQADFPKDLSQSPYSTTEDLPWTKAAVDAYNNWLNSQGGGGGGGGGGYGGGGYGGYTPVPAQANVPAWYYGLLTWRR
jgi:hypothetical protein